jgi:NitT/TauT family transport system ATP-binding protein
MKKAKKPTAIPPLPNARIGSIVGLLETLNEHGTKIDLYKLSQSLHFNHTELIPITEAAELLGFVRVENGDIELADLGRKVIDGDENAKKAIFHQKIAQNVTLAKRITSELGSSEDNRVGRERILDYLGSSFVPEESERQIGTIIDWARYAELFDYDPDSDEFFLPEGAETT